MICSAEPVATAIFFEALEENPPSFSDISDCFASVDDVKAEVF